MNESRSRRLRLDLLACAGLALLRGATQAATYSLADDFSYTENRTNSLWSYRLDDFAHPVPAFPLLTMTNRDVNALWGSSFPTPPLMWSEASGYWGIGKNLTGSELFSARNGTRWAPGEVLFHPKGGAAPAGLVVGWTAPSSMVIDVHYTLGRGAEQSNGIGYQITRRSGGADLDVARLENIGSGLTNDLTGIVVAQGDQLFFRFDPCGDPVGDISRADIRIEGKPTAVAGPMANRPWGGTIAEGSDFTFSLPVPGTGPFQWRKDGSPIPGATNASYRIQDVKRTDAGAYSVVSDAIPSMDAPLRVTPQIPLPERFHSPVPRQVFSQTLAQQEAELKTNKLMLRFAASRKKLATDPYRPSYHFISPESQMNDPNGLCFWQGRGHLFYQAFPADKFPEPGQLRDRLLQAHWGHAVTDDWVHWRDLPYALYPGIEKVCASGGTVVEENRVVAFYPGWEAGQMVAIATDPLLLNWTKLRGRPINAPASGDSCIWKEGDTYCGLIGCRTLLRSQNLVDWEVLNSSFLGASAFPIDDGSCPTFLPIGDKHILLLFSHARGGQYLLGDYDRQNARFNPLEHGRFNHGTVAPGGVHAPSGVADGQGGVINILNLNDGRYSDDWDQLMSLAQRLTLGPDKRIRIDPVEAVASLRGGHQQVGETVLRANQEIVFDAIRGNTLELEAEIDPQMSRWVQLNVLRSPNAEEQTSITFFNFDRKLSFWYHTQGVLCLDGSRSSTSPEVWVRPPERAVFERGQGETLRLRVFVDRSVVEVFANGKLYLAMRVYPGRNDSVGVSVRAQGQEAVLKRLDAWAMKSIWSETLEVSLH